ncbi:MAG: HAMP domain-containing histidine kinase [Silvibacterium sp.]|nr:HAMP domain-containing histidine kinase [Silvibacterium sp.]
MGPQIALSSGFLPKVLLLANDLASAHAIREAIRRSGLTLVLETVASRSEFLLRLQSGLIDLILAAPNGLDQLPVTEIPASAAAFGDRVPLIVIGKRGDTSAQLKSGTPYYVDADQLERLPAVIERALHEGRRAGAREAGRRELERAAEHLRENQKLLTLGRLTASIVHEINNPLESLTNLLYLMEIDHESREKRVEYLKMAQRELNRVVQISRQTLSFSRETSTPVRLQMAELTEEVLVLYGRKIADKNIRVIRQYESSQDVIAFPGEMRQVLSNLITNAIEATGRNGRLILRIRNARKWSDQGVRGLSITVADNGSGIPAEAQKRLGEPFFTTKGQSGTGLGLWVTRSILSRYGGTLRVRSSVSQDRHGTVFSAFVPTNMRPVAVISSDAGSKTASSCRRSGSAKYSARSSDLTRLEDDQLVAG